LIFNIGLFIIGQLTVIY